MLCKETVKESMGLTFCNNFFSPLQVNAERSDEEVYTDISDAVNKLLNRKQPVVSAL